MVSIGDFPIIIASAFILSASTHNAVEAAPQAQALPAKDAGAESYAQKCAISGHGDQREGILPAFPPLLGIHHQLTDDKLAEMIHLGKGRMPGFPDLQGGELTALVHFLDTVPAPANPGGGAESALVTNGEALFHQNCAFCHGRDAMGGESGPDLTESKLVQTDKTGEEIAKVIHEGRQSTEAKMPGFNFSSEEVRGIIAFIHAREIAAAAHPGGRRGVAIEDLQTGNVDAGRQYFNGAGGCVKCHSPQGDLAGIAHRFQGLQLEQRMLYPRNAKSTVTVTLPSGQKIAGTLAYLDEFTVALRDGNGVYRSWATGHVKYDVRSPADAHVEQFSKYTDADIHNLMAYLQTLK